MSGQIFFITAEDSGATLIVNIFEDSDAAVTFAGAGVDSELSTKDGR